MNTNHTTPDMPGTVLSACADCYIAVANLDFTGMDDDRAAEVAEAVEALPPFATVGDDLDTFAATRCEVCGSPLAGSRHEVIV